MRSRKVVNVHAGRRDDIGDLRTHRPDVDLSQNDPFLLINHHGPQVFAPNNRGLPFGPHPHRGFETVTFILHGALSHWDSDGHESVIDSGGVQWMTAGAGVFHNEFVPPSFRRDGGALELLQLWVNLPARLKMAKPVYQGVQRAQIPRVPLQGSATVNVISGTFEGRRGPIESLTGAFMSMVTLEAEEHVILPAPVGRNVFFYIVEGQVCVDGQKINGMNLVEFDREGDQVLVEAASKATIIYGHADVIGEPVVAGGPFVMNTESEIVQAFSDFRNGRLSGGRQSP